MLPDFYCFHILSFYNGSNAHFMIIKPFFITFLSLGLCLSASALVEFPGNAPGASKIQDASGSVILGNDLFYAKYNTSGGKLSFAGMKAGKAPIALPGGELFILKTKNGGEIKASAMTMQGRPKLVKLAPNPKALNLAEREPGKALLATFISPDKQLRVIWKAIVRDGSHYLRHEMAIASSKDVDMDGITAMQFQMAPDAKSGESLSVSGNTRGSLLVTPQSFAGLETPMGKNSVEEPIAASSDKTIKDVKTAQGFWSRKTTLKKGEPWQVSSVLGILAPEQARRSVLAYTERERVVPYRPFIHYNSWYELNINRNNDANPMKRTTEPQCLAVLDAWNEEMFKKRKTSIDAFVWDDGWDEFNSLWDFHKGFPNKFNKINQMAKGQKAGIGVWLGPVGGYGSAKQQRLDNWNENHPNNKIGNFQLADKEYYDAFYKQCSQMVKDYDMRYFKFDGISTHFHATGPNEQREEDAEGILRLVRDLRKQRGDLFINCTVGTWASPFWFHFADSVWRQENDWGSTGVGNNREKWITYRDRLVWSVFVQGAPLCPINSLMTHGLMVTKHGPPDAMPKEVDGIIKEMRCAFGCGSALQELYVDNDMMSSLENGVLWDELAKNIKWIRANKDVLDDIHWVGGCPWDENTKKAEIYGWAAWNPNKATMTLRNPDEKEQAITTTLRKVLDLPPHVKGSFKINNTFADQRALEGFTGQSIDADKEITLTLKPFEVFVFDLRPSK